MIYLKLSKGTDSIPRSLYSSNWNTIERLLDPSMHFTKTAKSCFDSPSIIPSRPVNHPSTLKYLHSLPTILHPIPLSSSLSSFDIATTSTLSFRSSTFPFFLLHLTSHLQSPTAIPSHQCPPHPSFTYTSGFHFAFRFFSHSPSVVCSSYAFTLHWRAHFADAFHIDLHYK